MAAADWVGNVTGGAVQPAASPPVTNGVVSWIPQCSDVQYAAISLSRARRFDLTTVHYITSELIPPMIPGWVFGGIALAIFILFLLWPCLACCRRRWRRRRRRKQPHPEAAAPGVDTPQFMASGGGSGAAAAGAPRHAPPRRRSRGHALFQLALLALTLACVGVGIWGLVESIKSTNHTVSSFWALVGDVDARVDAAAADLAILHGQVVELSGNVSVLTSKAPVVARALRRLNITAAEVDEVAAAAASLPSTLDSLAAAIDQGRATLQDNIEETINDIWDKYEPPTMSVQDTWRFIPIAVLMGALILVSAACGLLCWRLRRPRTAGVATALLWLDVALLLLLGGGCLRGVFVGASDSCKYAETLALRKASETVADPQQREEVMTALAYYLGLVIIPDGRVVDELLGVPTYRLHEVVEGPVGAAVLPILRNPALAAAGRAVGLTPQEVTSFANISFLLPNISTTVRRLEQQALKSSIDPLYHSSKVWICCTLGNQAWDVWVAWTVAGVLGFVLGLLCTWRLLRGAPDQEVAPDLKPPASQAPPGSSIVAEPAGPPLAPTLPLGSLQLAEQPPPAYLRI